MLTQFPPRKISKKPRERRTDSLCSKTMKIGIETSCLDQTIRGIGTYTRVLLETLQDCDTTLFKRKRSTIPFSGSVQSLFRTYRGVDLIHFPEPQILYGKRPNVPFVLTIHDVMPLKFPEFFPKKHTLMMRHFLPRYLREADGIICVSEATKRDLLSFFPSLNPTVIPCGILPQEPMRDAEREPFFLYVGSFETRKNLRGIFQACEILQKRGFAHKLVIAGKPEGADCLPSPLPEGVEITGYVSEEKKWDLMRRATLLIWPSFYEGFGLPLLEAMAAGLPIVTSDRGACPETIGDAGLIVDPEDANAIADAMAQIIEDQALSHRLSECGIKRSELFALPNLREKLLAFYASVKCSDIQAI